MAIDARWCRRELRLYVGRLALTENKHVGYQLSRTGKALNGTQPFEPR